ncbi:MAG: ATP-binding protein, partial [Eubacteriales bacterium]
MQIEDLVSLVEIIQKYNCETQYIEVKAAEKGTPTKLYDTLSSFSNQDGGGTIVFGLAEKEGFAIVGVYDVQDLQHKVAEQCKQMEIPVRPLFTVVQIDEKMVVSAEIPGVDIVDRPVYYKGSGRVKGS